MPARKIALIALVLILGIVGFSSVYTVRETDQGLVLEFGKYVRKVDKPGLHFKIPFVQSVQFFDKRVLDYDIEANEIPTSDQKQAVVDTFVRYRITDALEFFKRARTERNFQSTLKRVVSSSVQAVFARVDLATLLTPRRAALMEQVSARVRKELNEFGVRVIDVRVKRIDLPRQNSEPIYRRMETQRRQEATLIRAQGERDAKRIRADAEKRSRLIRADATRRASILRGQGEALAQQIYNKAYGQDPEFFRFWVSMNAMKESLKSKNTRYVGPADGQFFDYFKRMMPKPGTPAKK